jgi:hypothetical protein
VGPLVLRLLCLVALGRLVWVILGYYVLDQSARHHLESAWMIFVAVAIVAAAIMPSPRAAQLRSDPIAPAAAAAWIAASLLLYYQSLSIGLLSDDFVLVTLSPLGTDWQFFRPLPLAAWKIVYPLAGPMGLHVLNATLHGINAFLVFRLTAVLLADARRLQSVAAGALFLTFPAAVEPVAWAAGVFDVALVTAGLTYLNALLRSTSGVSVPTLAALAAALLCKETAVALPVLGWCLRLVAPVHLGTLAWSTGMAVAFTAMRMFSSDAPEISAPLGYFLKEMVSRPFATLGTPFTGLELSQAPAIFGVVPQLVLAALVMGYLFHRRHGVRPLVPASWILLGVAPLLSYFFISDTLQGSRYLYLPLVGWSVLVVHLSDAGDRKHLGVFATLLVSIIILYGVAGSGRHQAAWVTAAATRDVILLEAQRAVAARECETAAFAGIPDSDEGAYLFRNGFVEAARAAGVQVSPSAAVDCTFTWRDGTFVADPEAQQPNPRTK